MSKSLVAISAEVAAIEQAVIEASGELDSRLEEMLTVSSKELAEKVDAYDLILGRLSQLQDFYNTRAEMFFKLAKRIEAAHDRLDNNILMAMQTMNVTELSGDETRFAIQSAKSCKIENEAAVPGDYKITETFTKLDRKKILADMKLGLAVDGASLVTSYHVRKYTAKPKGV